MRYIFMISFLLLVSIADASSVDEVNDHVSQQVANKTSSISPDKAATSVKSTTNNPSSNQPNSIKLPSMPTIAVLDFSTNQQAVQWYLQHTKDKQLSDNSRHSQSRVQLSRQSYSEVSDALTSSLNNYLVQSHKFAVLDRQRVEKIITEQDFGQSSYTSPAAAKKIGHLLGADYLLTGRIEVMDAQHIPENIPYTSKKTLYYRGVIGATIEVIDTRTGQMVAAYPIDVRKEYRPKEDEIFNKSLFLMQLKDRWARSATNKILSAVFPVRIIDVRNGVIWLDRGSTIFHKNQRVALYQLGKPLVDPNTKRVLGVSKSKLGLAQITEVNTKYSVAKVIGKISPEQLKNGIAEIVPSNTEAYQGQPSDTPGSSAKPIQW